MYTVGIYHMDIAIQSGSGIPSGSSLKIFKLDYHIIATGHDSLGHICIKGIVPIGPISNLTSIDFYMGIAHCSIKYKRYTSSGSIRHIKCGAVCSFANKWKTSCTSCFYGFLLLAVLFNSYCLNIVCTVKRSVYSPVVRNSNLLPFR